MTGTRFITKNGTSVDRATVQKRFFESTADAEINPPRAIKIWRDAMQGDADARELIEQICGIQIVDADTGFGFP